MIRGAVLAAALLAAALVPAAGRDYYATLMLPFFAYGLALLGLNLLFGYAGLLSFGHALFVAVGAYTAAYLTDVFRILHFELVLLAAAALALAVAVPVGLLCVRYVKIYFGILTLAFDSELLGRRVENVVWLPDAYFAGSSPLPVVYYLHGTVATTVPPEVTSPTGSSPITIGLCGRGMPGPLITNGLRISLGP